IDLNKIGIEITLYLLKTQENIKTLTEYYEINKMRKPDLMVNTYAGFYIYKGKESSITQTEIASFVNDKFEGLL
ncbi:MAG: hypothetical protein J5928_06495, partial [Firmicutes bacterium]|nr:hypothetical protein [Bacillota bacterium]